MPNTLLLVDTGASTASNFTIGSNRSNSSGYKTSEIEMVSLFPGKASPHVSNTESPARRGLPGNDSSLALPSLDLTGGAGELERPSLTDDLPEVPPFAVGFVPQPSFATTTLGAVLADAASTALFTQHLQLEFNCESYVFVMACDRVRANPSSEGKTRVVEISTIYDQFLRSGAALEINVSCIERQKVEQCVRDCAGVDLPTQFAVKSEAEVPVDILESIRQEVFKLLEGEHAPRLDLLET